MGEDDQAALDEGLLLATKIDETIDSHRYGRGETQNLAVAERTLKTKASHKTLTSNTSCARGGERG